MDQKDFSDIPPSKFAPPYQPMEEDEINLLDLLLVLVRHKWLIFWIVFFSGVAAVAVSLMLPNVYRSEATIILRPEEKTPSISLPGLGGLGTMVAGELGIGGGGTLEKLEVFVNSRYLTNLIINKYKLMPTIYADDWDADNKKWLIDKPPTVQDGFEEMKDALKISVDATKGTMNIGFEHEDPKFAKTIVEYYLKELSEAIREEVLRDAAEKMRFFREQLDTTSDTLLKDKIYALLANEIEKETFARAQKYYYFLVLDPPIVPDLDKKVKPKRSIICILSVFVAFFLAVFLAFFKEFAHRIKVEDPERYEEIVLGLKLRKRKPK